MQGGGVVAELGLRPNAVSVGADSQPIVALRCSRLPLFPSSACFLSTDTFSTSARASPDCARRSHSYDVSWKPDDVMDFVVDRPRRSRCQRFFRPPRSTLMENAIPPKQEYYTVGDFMTRQDELFVVKPSTTVDEALEVLVENRITGLPVVDDNGKLIGVVSDYDLLALDSISGKRRADTSLFPEAGSTWKAFKEIQKLLSKTQGKIVAEVMTPSPLVVREMTNLEDAARLLLDTKFRRLPVVNDSGKLVGLLTRGNVVRAALHVKRASEKKAAEGEGM